MTPLPASRLLSAARGPGKASVWPSVLALGYGAPSWRAPSQLGLRLASSDNVAPWSRLARSTSAASSTACPPLILHASRRSLSSGRKNGGADGDASPFLSADECAAASRRIKCIRMSPNSFGRRILPGGVSVLRTNERTGETRKVLAERALGHFWMMKDLKETKNKPVLANTRLVDAADSQPMPKLIGCTTLLNDDELVDLPDYFVRNNRSKDATAQCTLVVISYKDFGHKMLASWLEPFRSTLCDTDDPKRRGRYNVASLSINEGRVLSLLSSWITRGFRAGTPEDRHAETLLYFGDSSRFRDALRMHNTLTGYAYLLDGIGRVRWAGSGEATEEEVHDLIDFARELVPAGKADVRSGARWQQQGDDGSSDGGKIRGGGGYGRATRVSRGRR